MILADLIARNRALWDGLLALIPVVLGYCILWVDRTPGPQTLRNILVTMLGIAWFAFLPNTCYLLTEWRHFMVTVDAGNLFLMSSVDRQLFVRICELWLFYFIFSGFGMMTFALAIRPVKRVAASHGATTWFWTVPFFCALSLGVYLGLVLRYNSWDIVAHPHMLWESLIDVSARPRLIASMVGFGIFLWIAYEAIDIWIDGLTTRWSNRTGLRFHVGPKTGDGC
ncbi:MAG: DUF1361 domain-containing protein [Armatimonadota bacterium]